MEKHLYVAEDGLFHAKLSPAERKVMNECLARKEVAAWLRNIDRKTPRPALRLDSTASALETSRTMLLTTMVGWLGAVGIGASRFTFVTPLEHPLQAFAMAVPPLFRVLCDPLERAWRFQ